MADENLVTVHLSHDDVTLLRGVVPYMRNHYMNHDNQEIVSLMRRLATALETSQGRKTFGQRLKDA